MEAKFYDDSLPLDRRLALDGTVRHESLLNEGDGEGRLWKMKREVNFTQIV